MRILLIGRHRPVPPWRHGSNDWAVRDEYWKKMEHVVTYYPFFSTGGTHLRSNSGLNAFSEGLFESGKEKNCRCSDMVVWGSSRHSTSGGEGVVVALTAAL